jgi:hypothetical protein
VPIEPTANLACYSEAVIQQCPDLEPMASPACYAEAVIQQCPDLECSLTKVCRDFAKCNIKDDPTGFMAIIHQKMLLKEKLFRYRGNPM